MAIAPVEDKSFSRRPRRPGGSCGHLQDGMALCVARGAPWRIASGVGVLGVRQGWLTENRLWSRMLQHLGVGFLVSSIAVFGYEWSGHLNKTIHVGDKLRQEFERIHLLHSSIGRDSIQQGLDEVFTPKKEGTQDVIRSLMALIDIIVQLEAQNDRNYINFNFLLLDEMVVRNANILVEIDHDDGNVARHFTLDLAECAAKLLVAQMDSMKKAESTSSFRMCSRGGEISWTSSRRPPAGPSKGCEGESGLQPLARREASRLVGGQLDSQEALPRRSEHEIEGRRPRL